MIGFIKKTSLYSLLIVALLATAGSCKLGLGSEIDLEAPELSITSHRNLEYVGVPFTLKGKATDNVRVTDVSVFDARTGEKYGKAKIDGDNWAVDLELPEGDTAIRVEATDRNKNTSSKSVRQITLMVDSTPPLVKSVEIERPGGWRKELFPYESLYGEDGLLEELGIQYLEEDDYANVDSFQNEAFTLLATLEDDSNVQKAVLILLDVDGDKILSKETGAQNNFNPQWTITHEELVAENSDYATGKHYFRVTITSQDEAGNNIGNTDQFLWLCWYPEHDVPHINPMELGANGGYSTPKGSSVSVEFFDDDGLESLQYELIESENWTGNFPESLTNTVDLEGKAPRQKVVSIPCDASGEFKLLLRAKDKKAGGAEAKVSTRVIDTLITDKEAPIIVIESPEENTFPTIESGKFSIKGYVLDNHGAKFIRIAWLPDSQKNKVQAVETALKKDSGYPTGVSHKNLSFDPSTTETIGGIDYWKAGFSTSYHIIDDFGSEANRPKLFILYTNDADGNDVYRRFNIQGNERPPEINFTYPANLIQIHKAGDNLSFKFTVTTPGKLPLKSISLQQGSQAPETIPVSGFSYNLDLGSNFKNGERHSWTLRVEDILGNVATDVRELVFTDLPFLQEITSGAMDGTFKANDKLLLQAVFSDAVLVPSGNAPQLDLRYNSGDTSSKYATYKSGSGTNTLYFEFTVPSGAASEKLRSASTPLVGGQILSPDDGVSPAILTEATPLQDKKSIKLDGVAPTITTLTTADEWYKAGDVISFTLSLSENILVSGSPKLRLNNGIQATFVRTSGEDAVFEYLVPATGAPQGDITWNLASCIANEELSNITDMAGNPLALTSSGSGGKGRIDTQVPAVPDITSPTAGAYNSNPTLTIDILASSGSLETTEYSTDGGLTWHKYNSPVDITADGVHSITARRSDAAGNMSANADPIEIEIGTAFPALVEISCENPDGLYTAGSTLTFKALFDRPVKTSDDSLANIKLTDDDDDDDDGPSITVTVTKNTELANALYFKYTVGKGLELKPVSIASLDLSGVSDRFGNTPPTITDTKYNKRDDLKIDSLAPSISSTSPDLNAIIEKIGDKTTLTLNFSEEVWVETGIIKVERNGNWLVPPVFTEAEFSSIFLNSALTDDQRKALMMVESGSNPKLDDKTAQPVGPYKKITHGVMLSGEQRYVPDTSTKYVLDFEKGLDDADIRAALEAAGYHRHEVDATNTARVTKSGSAQIKIEFDALADGREWVCSIPAGTFRDEGGNPSVAHSWTFWSDKVATPVIRVDRYSQGEGAKQPSGTVSYDDDGVWQSSTIDSYVTYGKKDKTTRPSGLVRVRIDCETPGASIEFGAIRGDTKTLETTSSDNNTAYKVTNEDISSTTLQGLTTSNSYSNNSFFLLGDGGNGYDIASFGKYYVAASATKSDFTESDKGYEGAYKSLIMYKDPYWPGSNTCNFISFEGSDILGGMPTISGFPMRDADPDLRYSKFAFNINTNEWYWQSWEIVSTWYNQSWFWGPLSDGKYSGDWQRELYGENDYGGSLFINRKEYWGGTQQRPE